METVSHILQILDYKIEAPVNYGWFHIMWLVLMIAAAILLCLWHKHSGTQSRVRKVVLITAITVTVLEVYKMINYNLNYDDGVYWDFEWYAFPWQFCSTPMFVGLLAGMIRKGKVHEALCAYLATFALFAGLCVSVYPGEVFVRTLGINIQTMICHGSMVSIGIYLLYSGYVKTEIKTVIKAIPVFAACVIIAMVLNEVVYYSGVLNLPDGDMETFNMFFISRHFECTLPVYSLVHNAVPFPVNLIIYIVGFSLASFVIMLIAMGIRKLGEKGIKKEKVVG